MKRIIIALIAFCLLSTDKDRANCLRNIDNKRVSLFINNIYDDSKHVCDKNGLPVSLLIAQAALESGWGTSNLCINKCNWLGIKKSGQYQEFESRVACFEKWAKVLNQGCYKGLNPKTTKGWLYALQECHYFTSKSYRAKINSIIKKYGLEQLNK